MFLHRESDPAGSFLIHQVSHAWLAWQVAEHWGNRRFVRPAPRAEVLAGILLHDSGWSEFDTDPGIDDDGRPVTFNRMPVPEHLEIWRTSVARAGMHSRYSGLLVASHFAGLADKKTADLLERADTSGARATQSFRAEMDRVQASWREALSVDARYKPYLEGAGWDANALLLEACDRISVYLCGSLGSPFEITAQAPSGQEERVQLNAIDAVTWRLHPWPLEGDRLRVQCDGRKLSKATYSSAAELRDSLLRAPIVRLSFTLVRPSASG